MIEETYLPQCLAIGIRADEFWNLNIRKLRPFLKAEEIKFQTKNRELHLQGQYVYDAVMIAIANAFSKGSPIQYPEKPYEFLSKEEIEKRRQQAEVERLKGAFMAFAETTKTRLEHGN